MVHTRYDAFISYSHKDREWVNTHLLPALERAGLRVAIDYRDFDVGRLARENMELCADASRHVVLVISPNWVASEWTNYEYSFVQADDPVGRRRKLIPILIASTQLPRQLCLHTHADFCRPEFYDREIARVIRAVSSTADDAAKESLPAPPMSPAAPPAPGAPLSTGVEAPAKPRDGCGCVKEAALRFRTVFETARTQIREVTGYKGLHDRLHDLQQKVELPMEKAAPGFPADPGAALELDEYRIIFEDVNQQLRVIARQFTSAETMWIDALDGALSDFNKALRDTNPTLLKDVLRRIRHQLSLRLPQVNTRLNAAANALRLGDLVRTLRELCDQAVAIEGDSPRLQHFRAGVETLDGMHTNLNTLLERHDIWQEFDAHLRVIESNRGELVSSWPDCQKLVERITAASPDVPGMESFRRECEALQGAVASGEPERMFRCFRLLRRQVGIRFYNTDADLKKQGDALSDVGESLTTLLRDSA